MRALVLRPIAIEDIDEAALWYEGRRPGLGHEFLDAVDAMMSQIRQRPLQFPQQHQEMRRALLRRFPYGIFFFIEAEGRRDESIVVVACFHAKRNPHRLASRH